MNTETLAQEYDKATRSQKTGQIYSPSLKWGGWIITKGGIRHSFGSPLYNTKTKAIQKAKEDAKSLNAIVYIFSRNQSGCKHAATVEAPQ